MSFAIQANGQAGATLEGGPASIADFTLEAWCRTEAAQNVAGTWAWQVIASEGAGGAGVPTGLGLQVIVGAEGKVNGFLVVVPVLGAAPQVLDVAQTYENRVWVHLTLVHRSNDLTLYANGQALKTVGCPYRIRFDTATTLSLISGPTAVDPGNSNRAVADLLLWNRALPPEELAERQLGRPVEKKEGLVAFWAFQSGAPGYGNRWTTTGKVNAFEVEQPPSVTPPASQPVPDGQARPLLQLDPAGEPLLLKYQLPEATSYRGRNVIELNGWGDKFKLKPELAGKDAPAAPLHRPAPDEPAPTPPAPAPGDLDGRGHVPLPHAAGAGAVAGKGGIGNLLVGERGGDAYRPPVDGTGLPTIRLQGRPDKTGLAGALTTAQKTGFLDPDIFPLMAGYADDENLRGVMHALKDIDEKGIQEISTILAKNKQDFVVYRATNGSYQYRFVQKRARPEPRPRLLLIEQYRLSSFLGQYGAGRTIKAFSLLPGEETKIYIRSYKATKATELRASSIIDSTSVEAEREFEQTTMQEQTSQENLDSSFEYNAQLSVTGNASWGWGDASVTASGGISGSTAAARESFAKTMSNAVQQHADRASSSREVSVETSYERSVETTEEQAIERWLRNINVSRTLNFAFRQMNQEYISVLHLTDIRVAYFNGYQESRDEVALHELPLLLRNYIDKEEDRTSIKTDVENIVKQIKGLDGNIVDGFIKDVKGKDKDNRDFTYLAVNRSHQSTYRGSDGKGATITVPGVLVDVSAHIMRTDAVVVDTFLGQGDALDDYSHGLQNEAIRTAQLTNDRLEVENEILREALLAARSDKPDRAKMLEPLLSALSPKASAPAAKKNEQPAPPSSPA